MRCNQCDSLYINGVFCHESGCPNTDKEWDPETEEWVVTPDEDDSDNWSNWEDSLYEDDIDSLDEDNEF